jgi:hypothetical protein
MTSGAVQTTVDVNPAIGAAGQLYDNGPIDVVTRVATVAIPFGSWVEMTPNGNVELPEASGDVTAVPGGIALIDKSKPTGVGYEIGDLVNVLQKGRVWIQTEDAIADLTVPYVRYVAAAGKPIGGFSGASDAGKNVQPLRGAVVKNATTAAGFAILDLNLPE